MGVATGIAVAAGVSALAGAYSAHKQSQAAEDAANSQTAAGDKALAIQKAMYDQTRADNDPYLSAGRQALGNLSDLSQRSRMVFDPNNPASWSGPPKPRTTAGAMPAQAGPGSGAGFQSALPSTDPRMGGSPPFQAGTASLGQPGGAQGPSGMVLMQSPDGEKRPVPASMVQQFIQRGGKVVQ